MSLQIVRESPVSLPSLADLEPLPQRFEEERRTVPGWLSGEPADVIRLVQIIEDIDLLGPDDVREQVAAIVPGMLGREVETLISYASMWLTEAMHIESGSEPTSYQNNAWEQEVDNLRGSALTDLAHAVTHFGVTA